ncbi:flavodoxin family protein [Chloroflexota bacterium]
MSTAKVITILGSPRKNGNCAILTERVADGVRSMGGEVDGYYLHYMNISPCDGCDICQGETETNCIIDDDMKNLYPRLREADALLIASPIYYFTVTAQTKLFMDRCHALGGPQGYDLKGKRIGIVLTYGDSDPFDSGAENAIRTLQDIYNYIGAEIVGTVHASAMEAGEISSNLAVMSDAFKLGKKLATGI